MANHTTILSGQAAGWPYTTDTLGRRHYYNPNPTKKQTSRARGATSHATAAYAGQPYTTDTLGVRHYYTPEGINSRTGRPIVTRPLRKPRKTAG